MKVQVFLAATNLIYLHRASMTSITRGQTNNFVFPLNSLKSKLSCRVAETPPSLHFVWASLASLKTITTSTDCRYYYLRRLCCSFPRDFFFSQITVERPSLGETGHAHYPTSSHSTIHNKQEAIDSSNDASFLFVILIFSKQHCLLQWYRTFLFTSKCRSTKWCIMRVAGTAFDWGAVSNE